MQGQYNMRSPAVKRLMKEAQELRESTELYHAQPLEDNLFEWHFTLRGPEDSDFDGGIYHGRIILPPEYPMKPPSIILLTPNGRFETFKKICLSISGHHPESWQPSWSIRTALLAIIGFMPTHGGGAIGSLDYTTEERKVLAKKSQDWKCPECGDVSQKLKARTKASEQAAQEARELASQINFQGEKQGEKQAKSGEDNSGATATSPSTTAAQPTPPSPPSAAPLPPPFTYPWAMAPRWGAQSAASTVPVGSGSVPRFPYPPPMMMPPPGLFMTPPPSMSGQRLPPSPPMPLLQPGMEGFAPWASAAGATGGEVTTPQTEGPALPPVSQAVESGPAPSPPARCDSAPPSSAASATVASSTAAPPPPPHTLTTAAPTSVTMTHTSVTAAATASADTPASGSPATTPPPAASSGPAPAASPELRQRSTGTQPTAPPAPHPAPSTSPAPQPTAPPAPHPAPSTSPAPQTTPSGPAPPSQWGYSAGTVVLMVLLSLAITLLLGRRICRQYLDSDSWGSLH